MKPIKMLGLAALAALLAMAFVGASLAMAEPTTLCSDDTEEECTEITHVHETSEGKAVLKSSLPTIECTVLFLGDTAEGTSAPLVIEGTFTYSSCNNFCSLKEENGPAEIGILRTNIELGIVTREALVNVKCPFINCNYTGEGQEGHALGALSAANEKGEISFLEQETTKESGSCPENAFFTVTTVPLVGFFMSRPVMVCIDVGPNRGHFLSVDANDRKKCANEHPNSRPGRYELAYATTAAQNEMVCANVGANGLWLRKSILYVFNHECDGLDISAFGQIERVGIYELGTVQ